MGGGTGRIRERNLFYNAAIVIGAVTFGCFVINRVETGIKTGAWTPSQIKQYNEKQRIIQQIKTEHENETNFEYGRLFEGNKDSIEVYKKYGFPIKLLEPTLEQKEKAIKQSELERSLKQKEIKMVKEKEYFLWVPDDEKYNKKNKDKNNYVNGIKVVYFDLNLDKVSLDNIYYKGRTIKGLAGVLIKDNLEEEMSPSQLYTIKFEGKIKKFIDPSKEDIIIKEHHREASRNCMRKLREKRAKNGDEK